MAYAARGWSAFAVLAPLAWTAAVIKGKEPAAAWRISGRFARLFFAAAGIPVSVTGLERLPATKPYVLLANHGSYLDGILLVGVLPRQHAFIAKNEGEWTPAMLPPAGVEAGGGQLDETPDFPPVREPVGD